MQFPKNTFLQYKKGIEVAKEEGILFGYPMIDFKVTLIDGSYHEVDSSTLAFELAAKSAFKEIGKSKVKLMEPIMKIEVITPEEYLGNIIGDIGSRRGKIDEIEARGKNIRVIPATVPLANMFGYVNHLRSISQGRAQYTMHFSHYSQVPGNVLEELFKEV